MPSDDTSDESGRGDTNDVIVPLELYKIVTVFSTLLAIVIIVLGFLALDAATNRATAPLSDVNLLLVALGLGLIALGGGVYAFSSRFRAPGMGKPKDTDDESSSDG